MRVLHVLGPSTGGIARHVQQLQRDMGTVGLEIDVVANAKVGPDSVYRVARAIKKGRYHIVHCHGFQGGAVGRVAAVLTGVPAVVTIHNTLQVGGYVEPCVRLAEGCLQGRTARWITVSSYLRNYAWEVLGVPGDRTDVISNGVDLPPSLAPWCPRPVVGTVARLIPSKGIDIFLRAVQLLRPEVPGLRAVIIGDGPARLKLRTLCHELGLDGIVEFTGHCDDVLRRLRKMAVFVLPTRSEGLGLSIIEAMAMGVPVVATGVGGVPELVQHGSTGFLVRPNQPQEIARRVRQILAQREFAQAMRHRAYEHVARNYTSQGMIESLDGVYRQVVNG